MSSYNNDCRAGWMRYLAARHMIKGLLDFDDKKLTNMDAKAFYKRELANIYKALKTKRRINYKTKRKIKNLLT